MIQIKKYFNLLFYYIIYKKKILKHTCNPNPFPSRSETLLFISKRTLDKALNQQRKKGVQLVGWWPQRGGTNKSQALGFWGFGCGALLLQNLDGGQGFFLKERGEASIRERERVRGKRIYIPSLANTNTQCAYIHGQCDLTLDPKTPMANPIRLSSLQAHVRP